MGHEHLMDSLFLSNDIGYLVERRFPLAERNMPAMVVRIWSSIAADLAPHTRTEAEAYCAELLTKSPAEISTLVLEERQRETEQTKQRLEQEERDKFYNQASAAADFEHYCKCAYWTLDEALALSFARQPTIVNWEALSSYVKSSAFAKAYSLRRELAMRAVRAGQLFDPVDPSVFLAWARASD